jgi:hypothetical protein
MLWEGLVGTAAGAVGTVALNMTTYLDMALRGRPPSSVSAKVVDILAQKAGIDLATGLEGERVQHRQNGLGGAARLCYGAWYGDGLRTDAAVSGQPAQADRRDWAWPGSDGSK